MTPLWNEILFDLDGTLTDSGPGILNSVRHALRRFGIAEADDAKLRRFVGPSLDESFRTEYGFDAAQTAVAIEAYREYFTDTGIFENSVYPGIPVLLQSLKDAGLRLYLATAKPLPYARRILAHFALDGYFAGIGAPALEGDGTGKAEIVARLLAQQGIAPAGAGMVGDRKYDILGAAANGLPGIGVLYGYGDEAELRAAGAAHLVKDVSALGALLLGR